MTNDQSVLPRTIEVAAVCRRLRLVIDIRGRDVLVALGSRRRFRTSPARNEQGRVVWRTGSTDATCPFQSGVLSASRMDIPAVNEGRLWDGPAVFAWQGPPRHGRGT